MTSALWWENAPRGPLLRTIVTSASSFSPNAGETKETIRLSSTDIQRTTRRCIVLMVSVVLVSCWRTLTDRTYRINVYTVADKSRLQNEDRCQHRNIITHQLNRHKYRADHIRYCTLPTEQNSHRLHMNKGSAVRRMQGLFQTFTNRDNHTRFQGPLGGL